MSLVEYLCPSCGACYETEVRADALDSCANDGCDGIPRRVWGANFARVPGGGRPHATRPHRA